MATKTKAAFNWADPLLLDQQITGDERAVRDAAESYCQEKLATRVLEGVPDHHDQYFSDAEHAANDQFTPCCSRAKSRVLVLDL